MNDHRREQLRFLLSTPDSRDARDALHRRLEAFYDALERIVGAPPGSLDRPSRVLVARWMRLLEERRAAAGREPVSHPRR